MDSISNFVAANATHRSVNTTLFRFSMVQCCAFAKMQTAFALKGNNRSSHNFPSKLLQLPL